MKANELRIGNWVMGNSPFQVDAMQISLAESREREGFDIGWQPIPLTKEWLERFGFRRIAGKEYGKWLDEWGMLLLFIDEHYYGMHRNGQEIWATGGKLYIHQLQNLYFALSRQEL